MGGDAVAELVGREDELRLISTALDDLGRRGHAIHLVGEPGVGKTALLHVAVEEASARDLIVLSVRGTQAESHLTFAALHALLRPVLGHASALPKRHRAALLGAFGMVELDAAPERLFVALAALELIADLASRVPALLVVDDFHWVDVASREAIGFIARRAQDEPIAILLSSRVGALAADVAHVGQVHELEGLDASSSRVLLRASSSGLSPAAERQVLQEASGNPLALLELPRALGATTDRAAREPLPLTERLERAFTVRTDGLPPAARDALLIAALQDGNRLSETLSAVASLTGEEGSEDGFSPAVAAGLISLDGQSFRFRHPLVRSAIVQTASRDRRRAAHRALSVTLEDEPDRATWHRSMAAAGQDEKLAVALEEGAGRAIARGAPDAAQEWLERAAELSAEESGRGRRLVAAAELAFELGRHEAVATLIPRARVLPLAPSDYARLAGLEGVFDDIAGDEDEVLRLVDAAERARASGDHGVAALLLMAAATKCHWGGAGEPLRSTVRDAFSGLALRAEDPQMMVLQALIDPYACGGPRVAQLGEWARKPPDDPAVNGLLARTAFVIGEFDRALTFASRACDWLRGQGRLAPLANALVFQAFAALYLGRWDITSLASDEGFRFSLETRQPVWAACAKLGLANVAGLRGDDKRAFELAAEVEQTALAANNRALLNGVQLTRGFAALGAGRPAHAFGELRRMFDVADPAFHMPQSAWAIDYLAEAAQLADERSAGAAILCDVERMTQGTPASGITRGIALARALLVPPEHRGDHVDEHALADATTPWHRARADLALGRWLRRQQHAVESRRPLAAAKAVFDGLGAVAWSAEAERELAAAGERSRTRRPDQWARLSPQELQIARLAAEGLSNREIAARLYLSHRTVASHLYRTFPKLGVTSRAQLHIALGEG